MCSSVQTKTYQQQQLLCASSARMWFCNLIYNADHILTPLIRKEPSFLIASQRKTKKQKNSTSELWLFFVEDVVLQFDLHR